MNDSTPEPGLRIIFCLNIQGIDPKDVSPRIGRQPDRAHTAGTPRVPSKPNSPTWPVHLWVAEWKTNTYTNYDSTIDYATEWIREHMEQLQSIAREADVDFGIVIYRESYNPGSWISKELVGLLAAIPASINLDAYVLGDD